MKKNHFAKTLMRIFAILASIGGVLFLFRDKILSCACVKKFLDSKEDCPLCSKLRSISNESESETFDNEAAADEEAFEHAFDADPATTREYVSLNINSYRAEPETAQEEMGDTL